MQPKSNAGRRAALHELRRRGRLAGPRREGGAQQLVALRQGGQRRGERRPVEVPGQLHQAVGAVRRGSRRAAEEGPQPLLLR